MKEAMEALIAEAKIVHKILDQLDPDGFTVTKQALLKAIYEAQQSYYRIFRPWTGVDRRKEKR